MKKIRTIYLLPLASVFVLLSACLKDIKDTNPQVNDFSNIARVQVINATVASTRNYVFVDGVPVTGASFAYGAVFPLSPNTSFMVPAGLRTFLIKDTSSTILTQPPMSFAESFDGNRFYTIFMYDTVSQVKQKTVSTNIVVPTDGSARVRFANFVYFPTIIPGIDIFSKKRNEFVVTNLLPTQVTDFTSYPTGVNDTLYVSEAGNPANRLDTLNGFNPTAR